VIGFDDSLLASLSSSALRSVRVDYTEFGAGGHRGASRRDRWHPAAHLRTFAADARVARLDRRGQPLMKIS
jgi:hypothetical protein